MLRLLAAVLAATLLVESTNGQTSLSNSGTTQVGAINYCGSDTGSGNTFTCSNPAGRTILAYKPGNTYRFFSTHANTGAATLAIDGLSPAVTMKKIVSGVVTDLANGDIGVNNLVNVAYDGTYMIVLGLGGSSGGGASNSVSVVIANEGTTGTTLNKIAKYTGAPSTAIISSTTDLSGFVGIVTAGAGTTGSATITTSGVVNCIFDNGTTANDYVVNSPTLNGDCHDTGISSLPANSGGEYIGRVLSSNASAGMYQIERWPYKPPPGILFDNSGQGTITCASTGTKSLGTVTIPANTLVVNGFIDIDMDVSTNAAFNPNGQNIVMQTTLGASGLIPNTATASGQAGLGYSGMGYYNLKARWRITGSTAQVGFGAFTAEGVSANVQYWQPSNASSGFAIVTNGTETSSGAVAVGFNALGCTASTAGTVTGMWTVRVYN